MGGFGSGRWRTGKKTTDVSKRLDIRFMRRKNLLTTDTSGVLSWNKNGNPIGSIGYSVYDDRLVLKYNHTNHEGENSSAIQQTICFDETFCNYGGKRKWFLCPNCGERRELLYLHGSRFSCRTCADLSYQCQHEQSIDRNYRAAQKIRHKLKTDGFNPDNLSNLVIFKPNGMHQATFNKLRLKQQQLIGLTMRQMVNKMSYLLDRF